MSDESDPQRMTFLRGVAAQGRHRDTLCNTFQVWMMLYGFPMCTGLTRTAGRSEQRRQKRRKCPRVVASEQARTHINQIFTCTV